MPIQSFERGIHSDTYDYNVEGPYSVDVSQLGAMAAVLIGAEAIVNEELNAAMGWGLTVLDQNIVSLMPGGQSGKLKSSTRRVISNSGLDITGEVRSLASIAPHNIFVDQGHGAIRPRRKKWLHYYIGGIGGREVFSKYSPPKAGKFFMKRGMEKSRSFIEKEFNEATGRIVFRIAK